ncbi:hypothetical protein ABVT39_016402 [Epinephelus coioides]
MAICKTLAVVVEGGVSSGSAEALASGGVNNNGAAAGNSANTGAQNGVPLNGEPLVGRLVQLGGSFFLQPVGNQVGQQLIPIGALQQGGTFAVVQAGANVNPQVTQGARGQPVTLFAVVPQGNTGGNQQGTLLTPGLVQLISVAGLNSQQQQPGPAGGRAAGRVRFQRSVAARLRRTQSPVMKAVEAEEVEENSGMEMEMEEKQAK